VIVKSDQQEEDTVKKSMKLFAYSLLGGCALLVMFTSPEARGKRSEVSRRSPTCGATVYGHTLTGNPPLEICTADSKPIFDATCHVYNNQYDTCPQDGTPLITGHAQTGGK
jgi:hypothetical protein